MRPPNLSPYHAKFKVPLNFSKFDLRYYLFHAYNVRSVNIRSSIKHSPIRDSENARRTWYREEQQKFMVIEMDRPFVWPAEPENFEPWGVEEKKKSTEEQMRAKIDTDEKIAESAQRLRAQAMGLLKKPKTWEDARQPETIVSTKEKAYKIRV